MSRTASVAAIVACAALLASPVARADRVEPVPAYGFYDVFIDFSKQTFNGVPTPMESKTFSVEFTTHCDVNGCVMRMDNSGDRARNPGAPAQFEYRWTNDRWETSGPYAYLCDRNNPNSVVSSQRSDFWIPGSDGSFHGERTLAVGGVGCPGEGAGTHRVPITMTPIDPPPG
ncbi:hypothetical protein [Mycobacterium sp. NPDC050041]|uniref:hypothetical protein n=1 Tax=Mycobacterium sp. NPDC050041 TaxID=3364293 RepID=UPI003C2FEEF2